MFSRATHWTGAFPRCQTSSARTANPRPAKGSGARWCCRLRTAKAPAATRELSHPESQYAGSRLCPCPAHHLTEAPISVELMHRARPRALASVCLLALLANPPGHLVRADLG